MFQAKTDPVTVDSTKKVNGTAKTDTEAPRKTVASQLAASIPPAAQSQSFQQQPPQPQQQQQQVPKATNVLSMDNLQKNVQNMSLNQSQAPQQSSQSQFTASQQQKAAYKSPTEVAPSKEANIKAQTNPMSGLTATMSQLNPVAANTMNISPSAPAVAQNLMPGVGVGLASSAPSAAVGAPPKPAAMAPPPPPPGVNMVNPNNQYMMNLPFVYYDVRF